MQRIRVQKISRWALAPVDVARTVAIAIRLILKLDLDEALAVAVEVQTNLVTPGIAIDGVSSSPHAY